MFCNSCDAPVAGEACPGAWDLQEDISLVKPHHLTMEFRSFVHQLRIVSPSLEWFSLHLTPPSLISIGCSVSDLAPWIKTLQSCLAVSTPISLHRSGFNNWCTITKSNVAKNIVVNTDKIKTHNQNTTCNWYTSKTNKLNTTDNWNTWVIKNCLTSIVM